MCKCYSVVATMLNFDEVYNMCCFHTNMVSISWVGIWVVGGGTSPT